MTPLAWLRSRRALAKPAAAPASKPLPFEPGQLAAATHRWFESECAALGYPVGAAPDTAEQPRGLITTTATLTQDETEKLRARFIAAMDSAGPPTIVALDTPGDTAAAAAGTTPAVSLDAVSARPVSIPKTAATLHLATGDSEPGWCPRCAVRYSRCYCGGNQ